MSYLPTTMHDASDFFQFKLPSTIIVVSAKKFTLKCQKIQIKSSCAIKR